MLKGITDIKSLSKMNSSDMSILTSDSDSISSEYCEKTNNNNIKDRYRVLKPLYASSNNHIYNNNSNKKSQNCYVYDPETCLLERIACFEKKMYSRCKKDLIARFKF